MSLMGQSDYMPNPVVLSSAPTAATLQAVTEAQKAARQVAAALNTAEGYRELKALWNKIDVNGDGIVEGLDWLHSTLNGKASKQALRARAMRGA